MSWFEMGLRLDLDGKPLGYTNPEKEPRVGDIIEFEGLGRHSAVFLRSSPLRRLRPSEPHGHPPGVVIARSFSSSNLAKVARTINAWTNHDERLPGVAPHRSVLGLRPARVLPPPSVMLGAVLARARPLRVTEL